jgi:hypothetical protein
MFSGASVGDGTHSAALSPLGEYIAGNFTIASNGHGYADH